MSMRTHLAPGIVDGAEIIAGAQLTGDTKTRRDPKKILDIDGIRTTQQYLGDEVQKVYREQGVSIHDKHVEVIVRQMLRRVAVWSPVTRSSCPVRRLTPASSRSEDVTSANSRASAFWPGRNAESPGSEPDPAQHLADDHLDVLVVDRHTLLPVHRLDLVPEVLLACPDAVDVEDLLRVPRRLASPVSCAPATTSAPSTMPGARCVAWTLRAPPRCRRRRRS